MNWLRKLFGFRKMSRSYYEHCKERKSCHYNYCDDNRFFRLFIISQLLMRS